MVVQNEYTQIWIIIHLLLKNQAFFHVTFGVQFNFGIFDDRVEFVKSQQDQILAQAVLLQHLVEYVKPLFNRLCLWVTHL